MDCRNCTKWIDNNNEANKITCARCHEPLKYQLASIARESGIILDDIHQGHGRRPALTSSEEIEVMHLHEQHWSLQQIADKLGVSKSKIYYEIHPMKLKKIPSSSRRPSVRTMARRAKVVKERQKEKST